LESKLDAAEALWKSALEVLRKLGGSAGGYDGPHGSGTLHVLRYLGEIAYQRGDYDQAKSYLDVSAERARQLGDPWRMAFVAGPYAYVLLAQGRREQARKVWAENVLAWQRLGNLNHVASALEGLACLASSEGHLRHAIRLAGAAAATRAENQLSL